ncbi:MAG: hypothetical protein RBQ71_02935 [Acholeplasmataceae bacterium]|jgi:hypothetical protein|nr:hypothetical protein [Acholeplasmataceae bacterium]
MTKRIVFIFILIVTLIAVVMNKFGYSLAETVTLSLYVLGISLALSLAVALPIIVLYLPPILHKKTRLDTAKQIMEDNIQVVEEAIFFKSNTKFQEIINKQIQEIKDNSSEIKRQKNILEDLVQDIRNTADDIEVAKKNKPKTKGKKKTTSDGSGEVKNDDV